MSALLLLVGALTAGFGTEQASFQTGATTGSRRDLVPAESRAYGVEIRAEPGAECRVASDTSNKSDVTFRSCTWTRPVPFSLSWNRQQVTLKVGRTTVQRAALWQVGNAIRLSAIGGARLTITRVGDEWSRTVVAGDPSSAAPVDAWISSEALTDGWTISGTLERRNPGASDAVIVTVGQDRDAPARREKPLTYTGGISGPHLPFANGLLDTRARDIGFLPGRIGAGPVRTWTGLQSGLWNNPSNWDPAGVPVNGEQLEFGTRGQGRQQTENNIPGLLVGGVTVNQGNYAIGGLGLTLLEGGTSTITGDFTVASLAGGGTVSFQKLYITGGTTTFRGSLSGSELILRNTAFTYSGNGANVSSTRIDSGQLVLNGGSLGDVKTEGGTFVMTNGATTRSAEGNSGQLGGPEGGIGTVNGTLRFNGQTGFVVPISSATVFQQIRVIGKAVLTGEPTVVLLNGYVPPVGTRFVIIDNDGNDSVGGQFKGPITVGSVTFDVLNKGGDGNDIELVVTGSTPPADPPNLTIAKTHAPASFSAGGQGVYTITVTNDGPGSTTATDTVTVTDTLPAKFITTAGGIEADGWTCTDGTTSITCVRTGVIGPKQSYPPIRLTVSVAPDANSGTNRVTVVGGGDATEAEARDQTPVEPPAGTIDLAISKSANPSTFQQGGQGTYVITVRNVGDRPSSGEMRVTDTLPAGLTLRGSPTSAGWTCASAQNSTITCTRTAALAPADSSVINIDVNVAANAPASVANTASVSGANDANDANNSASVITAVTTVAPELSGSKARVGFAPGQTGTVTLTILNSGNGPTSGTITVVDTFPPGFTAVAGSNNGWTCTVAAQDASCNRPESLAAGASSSFTIGVSVDQGAQSGTNRASVSGGGDNTPFDFQAPLSVLRTTTDLTIDKTHTARVTQGGTVVFQIVVTNEGQTASTGEVVVTDALPLGLTLVSIDGQGWSCDAQTVSCRRSDSLAGSTSFSTITLTATVGLDVTTVTNTATVSGGGDPAPNNNTDDDIVVPGAIHPDLAIEKSDSGPFTPGQQNATFTVTVRNIGAKPTSGTVTVTDTLPAGLTPTSTSGTGWSCPVAAQTVTCTRSDALAIGSAYPPITIGTSVAPNATSGTNAAIVDGGGDQSTGNNTASDTYTVIPPAPTPSLTLAKSHTDPFAQGQIGAVYTVVVGNGGPGATTSRITLSDQLPAGLVPTAASGDGWNCAVQGQLVTCTRDAAIAPQSTSAVTIAVNVSNTATNVTNVATVSGGGDLDGATAADRTQIAGVPQLTITKSHADPVLQGQQGLQFVLTVANNGTGTTAGSVTVSDTLPTGLGLVDATGAGWSCSTAGQTATCSRADTLAAGQSFPLINVSVNVAADAASVTNIATVSGGGDSTPNDNSASDLVAISSPGAPNLVMVKQHDGNFTQGQTGATYRLRVENRGTTASAGEVTVADDVPAGLLPTGVNGEGWNCAIGGQRVTCSRSDVLAAGSSWPQILLTVDVSGAASNVVNTASLAGGGDATPADNTASDPTTISPATIVPIAPDLRLTKRHQDPFISGQTGAAYHISVTNEGTASTAGEVTVSDSLPPGMTPTSATGSGWVCAIAAPVATCRRSDALTPGASYPDITLLVNVQANASSVNNVATVSGGGDTTLDNNTASDFTNVNGSVDASIALGLPSDLLVGTASEYVAQVRSLGPGTIGGETAVTADLPDVLIPAGGVGAGWQCQTSGQQIRCTRSGTFAPGTLLPELRFRVLVRALSSQVTTTATVDAPGDVNDANDRAEVTSASTSSSVSLRVLKTASVDRVVMGGSLTYRVEVANIGNARVTAAVLSDLLPRGFRYVESGSEILSTTRSLRVVRATRSLDRQDQVEWPLGTLSPGETVNVFYRVVVGADARAGLQDNRATVTGLGPAADPVTAGPAIATVEVVPDTFALLQALVGRVYEDVDGNGTFTNADRPLPNARVITSTGQAAITDPDGLYNIPSLGAGSVAVSLDRSTIPGHLTVADDGPGERSWSRLLRTPVGGGALLRQNFALTRAEGQTSELPAVVVPKDTAPPPESPLDKDAGPLPPRRDYQSREGASILLALGEVSFGPAAPEFEVFARDGDVWGYGSVFLQTPVGSERNRLTLAYDTHRRLNGTTGRERLFELDPNDRMYPVFGDTSRRQEFATANSKLFGRLERGNSYVMYGDLIGDLPSSARDGGRWSSYQRHLTGAEVRVANAKGDGVAVRAAQPTTAYARDVFSGSLLGLLKLRHGHVRPGTETIAIEVRDRRLPERVLSRDVLARAVDYELEPVSGAVFLRRHIGGLDSALNLVQLVATYEHESAGLENMIYSGRGTWAYRGLRLGGGFFTEEGLGDGRFNVAGVDLEQQLPRGGRLRLEVPYSHGTPRVTRAVDTQPIGRAAAAEGFGVQFDVEQPFTFWNGRATGNAIGADRNFQNPFSSTITPGARYVAGDVELLPRKPSKLRFGVTDEDYESATVDAHRTTLSGSWSETIAKHVTLTAGYDRRWLDRNDVDVDSGLATVAARVTVGSRFEAGAAREQNVGSDDDPTYPDQTTLRARFKVSGDTSLFYKHRISDDPIVPVGDFTGTGFSALPTTSEFSLGVESRVADATQLTSRYQVEQGIGGPDAFAVIGVVTQLGLWRGFTGTFGAERGELISGAGDDYTSGTLGISYLGSSRFKASARYEVREREGFAGLLTTGLATRLTGGVTGLFRADWLDGDEERVRGDTVSFLGALAVRPATNDRAGLLVSYQYVDRDEFTQPLAGLRTSLGWRQRLSTDGYVQPVRRLALHGKFAWQESNVREPYVGTYLVQGRAQVTIVRLVDAALEGRSIRQSSTSSKRPGLAAEVGFWPIADLRAALGFSFEDSRDPEGRDFEGRDKGIYVTLSTKLSRLFNLMGSTPPRAVARQ